MSKVTYFIKSKNNPTTIYVRFSVMRGVLFRKSTQLQIDPKFFSTKTGRLKSIEKFEGGNELNANLEKLRGHIISSYNSSNINSETIDNIWFSGVINSFFNREKEDDLNYLEKYAYHYVNKLPTKVNRNGTIGCSRVTIVKYTTILRKITAYEESRNKKVKILDVGLDFRDDFLNFLINELKLGENTAGRYIKFVKTICLDTLAENGTNKARQKHIIVSGEGSDLNKLEALKGRAKRKTITQIMMLKLIEVAQEKGEPELEKSYWNTFYCQQNIFTADGRLYGKYCKNRFCTLCCSIRKAELINKYYPVMKNWEEPYFVTLTVKSCKSDRLKTYIKKFIQGFKRITEKHRKRYQRGKGQLLIGVRSLECNFNPIRKTYNPHFHIITKDKYTAEVLLEEWLKLWTSKFTNRKGQNIQKVTNLESGLIEIIKYGSKIFTEPDLKKRDKETSTACIYIKALNTILTAMKGKRIFDRFGFNLPKETNIEETKAKLLSNFNEWEYNIKTSDWENVMTGEALTNYNIPSYLNALLENNINTTSE